MAPYQTVHLPPATQSDGLPEPTTSFVNLPDIPKLTFDSEIVEWASEIKSALNFLGLDNLIDPSKPRSPSDPSSPKSTQPLPLAWRFWSLTIRDWLFDQLGNEIQDLVNQLPTRPTYADDLWREIDQLHVRDPEEAARKATLTLFTMRRADYPSALEYVSRWQIQNGINRSRKVNVSPYMSIVIMPSQVEDELPKAAAFIRGQLAEKGVDAMSMEFSESERIGALLMLEASKLLDKTPPLPEVSESPFTKTINKFTDTENETKEDSTNSKGIPQETSKTCGPQKEIHEDEMESKTEEDPKELAQKSPEPLASRIEFCQTEMAERQTNERSNGLPYERSVAHVAQTVIRKAPTKGADHAEYAKLWRQHEPKQDNYGNCSYCKKANHGCSTCFYLADEKPTGWTPDPLVWCYKYPNVTGSITYRPPSHVPNGDSNGPLRKQPPRILRLPTRIRNRIWFYLFSSTELAFEERDIDCERKKTIRPATHVLAILRTCRRIKKEVESRWIGQVLFNFESAVAVLDKLSPLSPCILSKTKHLRVGGHRLNFMDPGAGRIVSIDLAWVLKLLPGLRLNTLTVLGSTHGPTSYMDFQELVRVGNGWRNLHFIAPNSKIFGFPAGSFYNEEPICREPQPDLWDTWVSLCRDGPNSGGSVTIYRSTQSNSPGSVFKTDTRKILKQRRNRRKRGKFGLSEDMSLMSESEVNKEILVIVNRGRNANIKEKDEPPYFLSDIRSWGMTWPEIRRECLDSTVPL